MSVVNYHRGSGISGNGGFLLIVQIGHFLLLFRFLRGRRLSVGFACGEACCRHLLICQLKHALDGTVVVANLVNQSTHHVLCFESLTGQVLFLHQRTVLPDGLTELLAQLIKLSLQLLRLAVNGLTVFSILVRRCHAHQFNVAVSVLVNRSVWNAPESTHRTDTAHRVSAVHHNCAVAQRCNQLTGRAAQAVHPRHRRLAFLAAVGNGLLVVNTRTGSTAGGVNDEDMAYHLRNGVGIHNLVTVILGAIRTPVTVARHGAVKHHHVHNLIVIGQFLVSPVQMVLDTMDVANV